MNVKRKENLAAHTTIGIGGKAENFYEPSTVDEIMNLTRYLSSYKVISGGSNLLINDQKTFENVISMKKLHSEITHKGNGVFYCSASVRVQKFIKAINESDYGGIEYLYSVPGLMGGIIFMNAGTGKKTGASISDFIINVYVIENGILKKFLKKIAAFLIGNPFFKILLP